ncbi:MAG: thioesterase family protein [Thermodesulfobacteriota bacterium]
MATDLSLTLAEPIHQVESRILYGDTDAGGVVYNANYSRFFELGRGSFMRELAFSYKELEELGYVLPVVETYLRFKAPARYDDLIIIKTCLAALTPFTCRFHCHIFHADTNRLLVKGFTQHAAISHSGRLSRLPAGHLAKLEALVARR